MAYTAIDNPELYFQIKLYTGDGSTQSITLDGDEDMQPDFVWIKNRDQTDSHCLFDSVRTATEVLHSDATTAETTDADTLTSFDSDGFALGADVKVNTDTEAYVAWNWKAGTAFSNDASATGVGSIDSSGSVNTDAGFSIVSYTGDAVYPSTVGHGLGSAPSVVITKQRTAGTYSWNLYHAGLGNTYYIGLNTTAAADNSVDCWNSTSPTSSVFTINAIAVNTSGVDFIAYCFADVAGYSKFSSYTGNGNADGAFVYTGFRPAWVMAKRTDTTASWQISDNKRDTFNVVNKGLFADGNWAESSSSSYYIDYLSNGFKLRNSAAWFNASGGTYIYMAFAEAPFVNSNGVPCNAR